jgi:FkbM family methyltransferase
MYKVPEYKKLLMRLIPNIKLLGNTPLGGEFCFLARTHKNFLFNRALFSKHEKVIFKYYRNHLNSNSIFYDVGANIGVHTVAASRKIVSGKGKVFSFEPDPENLNFLRENIALNDATSYCSIVPSAVGAMPGTLLFQRDTVSSATGRLALLGANSAQHDWMGLAPVEISVDCTTLDEVVFQKMYPSPDLIKVDVEGAELLVLQGAQQLLHSRKPDIIFDGMDSMCYGFLRDLGYVLYDMLSEMKVVSSVNKLSFTTLATTRSSSDI